VFLPRATANWQLATASLPATSLQRDALNPRVIVWAEAHHIRIFFQRIMNDPAIVGIHRVEFDRATGNPHGVGDLADTLSQFVVPHGAPVADVDLHSVRIPILGLKNPIQKKLQIFQGLSVGTDQCVAFGRKNLELTTAVGLDFLDIHDEAEVTKHRV
jgi:hypothetical protein